MSLLAVLLALLIEQVKPRPRIDSLRVALDQWMQWTGLNFDAGRPRHSIVVWCITVAVPTLLVIALYWGFEQLGVVLALAFSVGVLYATLGFRQFSHYFTDIRNALDQGDELEARRLLARWRHLDTSELPRTELLRHVIEHSVLAAHRHVFGVFFWAVLTAAIGLGPAGAVLYRLSEYARRYWARLHPVDGAPPNEQLVRLSQRLFDLFDYVPARMTAFGFAIVGNFEEAIGSWRRDAASWANANDGVLLASAAGAIGVQLGGSGESRAFGDGPAPEVAALAAANDGFTFGTPAQLGHLNSVVGLVWRSVVLWLLLLALLTIANLVG
jgi:adenosylcobinamide-phosphate synthase